MSELDKKTLEYLAELGRLELAGAEESKLLEDLREILDYFGELQKVDTDGVEPTCLTGRQVSGGTPQDNVSREDEAKEGKNEKITNAFPEKEDGFLKIPPVFE